MGRTAAFTFQDAIDQMGRCCLGHARRTQRLVDTTRRLCAHPGGSLPEKLRDPAAYQATLRLANQPAVTHAAVLRPHLEDTRARIRQTTATVLLVHDTTELDYSNQQTLSAMGQIGNGGGWGYQCHNSLAVDAASGELIGLVAQQLHNRVRVPKGEGVAAKRARESRESRLWLKGVEQVGPAPTGCHWVDVCDRGADTFEFLQYEARHGRHFVIRSSYNRALEVVGPAAGQPHLLHDYLRTLPAAVGWTVRISANKEQPARTARVLCCWSEVTVRAPHVKRGEHGDESLTVWALRVYEVDAPPEVNEPLEWFLLTDEPIADGGVARQRVSYYERRPRIEDYHKAMKTGMGVEQLQLQSQAGLQPLIALLSVLAVALVNAREAARREETAQRSAEEFFPALCVAVLSLWRYQEVRPLSVREYVLALGRLGGHLNRRCDGLPGWQTLWRGAMQLNAMVEYERARQEAAARLIPRSRNPDLSRAFSDKH
jgi:hypothetical protein